MVGKGSKSVNICLNVIRHIVIITVNLTALVFLVVRKTVIFVCFLLARSSKLIHDCGILLRVV